MVVISAQMTWPRDFSRLINPVPANKRPKPVPIIRNFDKLGGAIGLLKGSRGGDESTSNGLNEGMCQVR